MVGKTVLLTGGSGSLSGALIPRLQKRADVSRIVLVARGEHRLTEAYRKWQMPDMPEVDYAIGDVRDARRLVELDRKYQPEWVFHTAALKRIEMGERDPAEFMRTNVIGTQNVLDAFCCAAKIMLISTDKACAPLNAYGVSKAMAEKLVCSAGAGRAACRYGNILGSRGSVVELWEQQLVDGKPLTVTDPQMTRFWWTVGAAATYVIARMDEATGGEIFVPRLKAASILDLLVAIHGGEQPYQIIPVRPGEKQHEVMKVPEETNIRCLEGIFSSDAAPRLTADEIRRLVTSDDSAR